MSEKNQKSDHIQLADNKKVSEKVVAEKKMADQKNWIRLLNMPR